LHPLILTYFLHILNPLNSSIPKSIISAPHLGTCLTFLEKLHNRYCPLCSKSLHPSYIPLSIEHLLHSTIHNTVISATHLTHLTFFYTFDSSMHKLLFMLHIFASVYIPEAGPDDICSTSWHLPHIPPP
jgi:hypothetical protein